MNPSPHTWHILRSHSVWTRYLQQIVHSTMQSSCLYYKECKFACHKSEQWIWNEFILTLWLRNIKYSYCIAGIFIKNWIIDDLCVNFLKKNAQQIYQRDNKTSIGVKRAVYQSIFCAEPSSLSRRLPLEYIHISVTRQ